MENKEKGYSKLFREICKEIKFNPNHVKVLNLIIENLIAALDVKACTVFLWDRGQSILEVISTQGLSESYLKKGPVDTDKSITETLKGTAALIYDTRSDPRLEYPDEAKKEGIASILSVPISAKDQIIGVMRIYTSRRRNFSLDDYEFITGLADKAGTAIDNSRLYDHLNDNHESLINEVL